MGAGETVMRQLALSVEGERGTFPALAVVAGWLEALGLRAWVAGATGDAPPAARARSELPGIPCVAVRHPCWEGEKRERALSLFERDPRRSADAVAELVATMRWAGVARSPWVIVEVQPTEMKVEGESAIHGELDRLCRALHAAMQQQPGVGLALSLPRARVEWLDSARVALVLDDLGARRPVAWWHDGGRAHAWAAQGGAPASSWIDRLASRCVGLDATDAVAGWSGLPAGAGEVDLHALIGALQGSAWIVVRSEPFLGPGPLLAAVRHLRREKP
jgi:hypothetical protein